MRNNLIDGTAIAQRIKEEVREQTAVLRTVHGVTPGLAFMLVGEDPASMSYVASKEKACAYCGFHSTTLRLPADASESVILEQLDRWNIDPDIHGILVQLPLPAHVDEGRVIEAISPRKDVDGFHPVNVGKLVIGKDGVFPCTPAGIQELLLRYEIDLAGKHVVVLGRSNIVGKPIANILVQKTAGANAIVTIVHSAAPDIAVYTRQADVLIVAIGRPRMVTADMVKEGVVVIDVGINRVTDPAAPRGSRLVGDVDFDGVREKAAWITPVPGGVGPMTIAMLMKNTYQSAVRSVPARRDLP
ncbi:MAG: bifunctional methylenetetrahydrofolate dehydrogenase/methenyltetrahydrofolate cyclohydrolase FolD [Bacteroidota bacterium]|jgi:methylenetetrahydrofolate dehydrogenase (NADP+)/methenyltetrahydrofolate cyclohydrolase|nr:bifunctional methylenetetrahydrofolate dehydrogenase/methenyltetrahydrofolate cyclohydrolase FolD [Bacteroidota bacterium]